MARPRSEQISIEDTPYYHITTRCVRRAFLCGFDKETETDYEYRRGWIEKRIRILSSLFGIDIPAYAVMHNHIHMACEICPEQIEALTDTEVVSRWCSLYQGPVVIQKWIKGEKLLDVELTMVTDCITEYRRRLASISWFMKCLNEPIARQANKEDNCTGHFWEGRFTSQPLPTEEALLTCMAYIDLNPIRANIAKTPETSDYTSIPLCQDSCRL